MPNISPESELKILRFSDKLQRELLDKQAIELKDCKDKLNHAVNWIDGQGKPVWLRQPISSLSRVGVLELLK